MKKAVLLGLMISVVVMLLTGCPFMTYKFALTTSIYHCNSDLLAAAKGEFGSSAVLADWQEIKSQFGSSATTIAGFLDDIGMEVGEPKSAFVYNSGEGLWGGTSRHYYISRFNGSKPVGFLAHDQIGNDYLCLGSWDDCSFRILVKYKSF